MPDNDAQAAFSEMFGGGNASATSAPAPAAQPMDLSELRDSLMQSLSPARQREVEVGRQARNATEWLGGHLQNTVNQDVANWALPQHNEGAGYTTARPLPQTTDAEWAHVSNHIANNFPNVDPSQLRDHFDTARQATFTAQSLQTIMQRMRDEGRTGTTPSAYIAERLPFIGAGTQVGSSLRVMDAAQRIGRGEGSSADFHNVSEFLLRAETDKDKGVLEKIMDVVTAIPGFAVEFGLTGGAFSAGRAAVGGTAATAARAATPGIAGRILASTIGPEAAASLGGRAATASAGYLAGSVAQTALMPQRIVADAARRSVPNISIGGENGITLGDNGSLLSNLPAGALDTLIEVGSERAGEAIPYLAGQLRRIPVPAQLQAMTTGLAARWANSAPGRTIDGFREAIALPNGARQVAQELSHQFGYHGALAEMFEERVGELLRGATGLTRDAQGNRDYGMLSDALGGRWGEVRDQLLVEGVSFAAWGGAQNLAARAVSSARGPQQAGPQLPQLLPTAGLDAEETARVNRLNASIIDNATETMRSQTAGDLLAGKQVADNPTPAGQVTSPANTPTHVANAAAAGETTPTYDKRGLRQWWNGGTQFNEKNEFTKDGQTYKIVEAPLKASENAKEGGVHLTVVDANGKALATTTLLKDAGVTNGHAADMVTNLTGKRGEAGYVGGLGSALYDYATRHGAVTRANNGLKTSPAGHAMWERNAQRQALADMKKQILAPAKSKATEASAGGPSLAELEKIASDSGGNTESIRRIVKTLGTVEAVNKKFSGTTSATANFARALATDLFGTAQDAPQSTNGTADASSTAAAEVAPQADVYRSRADKQLQTNEERFRKEEEDRQRNTVGNASEEGHTGEEASFNTDEFGLERGVDTSIPTKETATPEAAGKPVVSEQGIIALMSKLFDVSITMGRLGSKLVGIYKDFAERIKIGSRWAGDIGVAAHETAHHIDKAYSVVENAPDDVKMGLIAMDYQSKPRVDVSEAAREGFAELVRMEMTGGTGSTVPTQVRVWFDEWLQKNADVADKIKRVRGQVDQWANQGAEARAAGLITNTREGARPAGETLAERTPDAVQSAWARFYTAAVDRAYLLKLLEQDAVRKGKKYGPGESPYDVYMHLQGKASYYVQDAVKNGPESLATGKVVGPALESAVSMYANNAEAEKAMVYILAIVTKEELQKGRPTGLSSDDADAIIKNTAPEHAARYAQTLKIMTDFSNGLLQVEVDAGMKTQAEADELKKEYPNYIPLLRVSDDFVKSGKGQKGDYFSVPELTKRRHGSTLQILHPMMALVEKANRTYAAASRQMVVNAIYDTIVKTEGMGAWGGLEPNPTHVDKKSLQEAWPQIHEILLGMGVDADQLDFDKAPAGMLQWFATDQEYRNGRPIERVLQNGQAQHLWLQHDLFQLGQTLNSSIFEGPGGKVLKFFSKLTGMVKMGATVLNPVFTLTNMIKDYQAWLMTNKTTGELAQFGKPFEMMARYLGSMLSVARGGNPDVYVHLYERSGGGAQAGQRHSTEALAKEKREIMGGLTNLDKSKNIATSAFEGVLKILGFTESGPRLAEFEARLTELGYGRKELEAARAKGSDWMPPFHAMVYASRGGADVTVDFTRSGNVGRVLNQIIPYFNPAIQGLDKFARNAKENPKRFVAAAAAAITITTLYWLRKKDDDHYKEVDDRTRFAYWIVGGKDGAPVVYIPKPAEAGAWIISSWEALLNTLNKTHPDALQKWFTEALGSTLNVRPVGTPVAEVAMNYDLFRGRPIVNENDARNYQPRDQYNPQTLAPYRWLGDQLNVSPAKMQHLASGLTGGIGDLRAARVPLVATGERGDTVNEFYRAAETARQSMGSSQLPGRQELSQTEQDAAQRLTRFATLMSQIRQPMRELTDYQERFKYEQYAIGLARFATGQPSLDRYPNPLTVPREDLPPDIRDSVDTFLRSLAQQATAHRPLLQLGERRDHFDERVQAWDDNRRRARGILAEDEMRPVARRAGLSGRR